MLALKKSCIAGQNKENRVNSNRKIKIISKTYSRGPQPRLEREFIQTLHQLTLLFPIIIPTVQNSLSIRLAKIL